MPWRRKPDGRPYADLQVAGRRRRSSLLKPGETRPWPDDAECERRYQAILGHGIPEALAHEERPADGPSLTDLCEWYADTIMRARGCTDLSRYATARTCREWCAFLAARGVRQAADLMAREDLVEAYVAERLVTHKPRTVRREIAQFRAVLTAAYKRRLIDDEPIRLWPRPKVADARHEAVRAADIRTYLNYLASIDSPYYPLLRWMAVVGCRASDACALEWTDVGPDAVTFTQRKTGHTVVLGTAARAILMDLPGPHNGPVFRRRDGRPHDPFATSMYVRRTSADALGPDRAFGGKAFRVAVVTGLLRAGYDRSVVGMVTGHRSDAIEHYVHLDNAHAAAAIDDLARQTTENPRADVTPRHPAP